MFDNVGKNTNRSARRQLSALLMALLSVGTTLSVLIWAASQVVEVIEKKDEVLEVPVSLAAPPPPPPPPGGSKKPHVEKKKDIVKPQEEVPQEVKPLDEPKPDDAPVAENDGPAGQEGGVVGGEEGGKVGGVVGSHGDTLGAPVVNTVHYSEVQYKVRPDAFTHFPKAAIDMGMKDERCQVLVEIDEQGKPVSAQAIEDKCPAVFRADSEAAAMHSEFYPYQANGQVMRVKFKWNFHYLSN